MAGESEREKGDEAVILAEINTLKQLDPYIKRARGIVDTITGHWTGGTYGDIDHSDYHAVIGHGGKIFITRDFDEAGAHTWMRNTGNLGVAMACCADMGTVYADGTVMDWGNFPPTREQVERMAEVVAYLAIGIGVPQYRIKDHHHWACLDGYGSDRVDVMALPGTSEYGWDVIMRKAAENAEKWGLKLP